MRKIIRKIIYWYWNICGIHIDDYGINFEAGEKRKYIKNIARASNLSIFVETGTYLGDTLEFLKDSFNQLISIELSDFYYKKGLERFKNTQKINLYYGDSSEVLPTILNKIKVPCLFWLDGHYSSGNTAQGDKDTPIFSELESIFNHNIKDHIILIDDARLFTGRNDYPWLHILKKYIDKKTNNHYNISVIKDIVVLQPKK